LVTNTTRIAKNTLALYFRQILIMLVSLYTVRVVLNTLGAEDYGIYNVVGGVVVMFSFQATGEIKKYQFIGSYFVFANLPISLLFLWLGFSPLWVLIVRVGLGIFMFVWRVAFVMKRINVSIKCYLRKVIIPVFIVTVISILVTGLLSYFLINWIKLIVTCIVSSICIVCSVYLIGLDSQERRQLKNWMKSDIAKNEIHR
jgi:hypothetical protein